jgi:hypothetical protein
MWELGANVSKDLETSGDLLDDNVIALTTEEQLVTQPISKTKAPPNYKSVTSMLTCLIQQCMA